MLNIPPINIAEAVMPLIVSDNDSNGHSFPSSSTQNDEMAILHLFGESTKVCWLPTPLLTLA
jgi:hypothetical protein